VTSFRPLPAPLPPPLPPRSAVRSVCRCDRGSDPSVPPVPPRSAVRSVCRCDRGSDPAVPELATEGLTQCRAPLHESPALHSSDPKPPFRCSASSFPSQCRPLSVATGGQTRCCQPSFARWHIGSDPFPPLVSLPVPPRSAVRSVCRCDRGSDPAVPELATEGLTQCRAPLHESPVLHSSDPKPPFRGCAAPFPSQWCLLSVAVLPPFRRFRGSDPLLPAELRSVAHRVRPLPAPFPSQWCLLSVAVRPPFRRSASPFPLLQGVRPAVASRASLGGTSGQTPCRPPCRPLACPFAAPFPAPCLPLPCAAPLRHQSHRQSERIQPQRMPQNGYLTAKQRDIFF